MNKVWKYITISLLLLLGLCCVGILYLFFVPNSTLFNITYINQNIKIESEIYTQDTISKVKLNSRGYDVKVLQSNEQSIYVKVYGNSFGFVLKKNSDLSITSNLNKNVLTFNIDEPYGLAAINASCVELYIPKDRPVDLTLNNKKAKTEINSNIAINNFEYSTHKGNCVFKKGTINGSLTLNLEKSDFKIEEQVQTNKNNIFLSLTTGSFKSTQDFGDVTIVSNLRGQILLNSCDTISENTPHSGGQITVNYVKHLNITAGDSIIQVNELSGAAFVNLIKSGKISINSLTGNESSIISTNSGDININATLSSVTLQSATGNIYVNEAYKTVAIKIDYGNANVKFADNADSYSLNKSSRILYATIKNGNLIANGVEHLGTPEETTQNTIACGIEISGNGKASIQMKNVYGINSISGNDGNVNVTIDKSSTYKLTTSSAAGTVRVNLTQTPEFNGYTTRELRTTYVNCSYSTHTLAVSTNHGNLTILDSNFV